MCLSAQAPPEIRQHRSIASSEFAKSLVPHGRMLTYVARVVHFELLKIEDQRIAAMSSSATQLSIGAFLAVQFAFQPLLTRWLLDPAALKSSVVLVGELVKLVTCLTVLMASSGNGKRPRWSPTEALWFAGLPALTYTAQNLLTQMAYQHLDGMIFNVINQTKILFNALFVCLIMGDGQSPKQVLALGMIFAASVLVSFGESSLQVSELGAEDFVLGAVCCFAGSALSGLGSAITEMVLVRRQRPTLMFSAELSAMSALSLGVNLLLDLNGDGSRAQARHAPNICSIPPERRGHPNPHTHTHASRTHTALA